MASRKNGHDVLTTLVANQLAMQTDITYIRQKVDFLYRIDPPGPLMLLSTHLGEAKAAKWRERTIIGAIASVLGTGIMYVLDLVRGK